MIWDKTWCNIILNVYIEIGNQKYYRLRAKKFFKQYIRFTTLQIDSFVYNTHLSQTGQATMPSLILTLTGKFCVYNSLSSLPQRLVKNHVMMTDPPYVLQHKINERYKEN